MDHNTGAKRLKAASFLSKAKEVMSQEEFWALRQLLCQLSKKEITPTQLVVSLRGLCMASPQRDRLLKELAVFLPRAVFEPTVAKNPDTRADEAVVQATESGTDSKASACSQAGGQCQARPVQIPTPPCPAAMPAVGGGAAPGSAAPGGNTAVGTGGAVPLRVPGGVSWLGNLLDTGALADVVFVVEGRLLWSHAFVLAAQSPVLSEVLGGALVAAAAATGADEGNEAAAAALRQLPVVVPVDDISYDALSGMLQFLYGRPQASGLHHVPMAVALFALGSRFKIQTLERAALAAVEAGLARAPEHVMPVLLTAQRMGCQRLRDVAVRALKQDFAQVCRTRVFSEVCLKNSGLLDELLGELHVLHRARLAASKCTSGGLSGVSVLVSGSLARDGSGASASGRREGVAGAANAGGGGGGGPRVPLAEGDAASGSHQTWQGRWENEDGASSKAPAGANPAATVAGSRGAADGVGGRGSGGGAGEGARGGGRVQSSQPCLTAEALREEAGDSSDAGFGARVCAASVEGGVGVTPVARKRGGAASGGAGRPSAKRICVA